MCGRCFDSTWGGSVITPAAATPTGATRQPQEAENGPLPRLRRDLTATWASANRQTGIARREAVPRGGAAGRGGGGHPAKADARARGTANGGRDDAGRVPPAHREGCGAGAPLPAGVRGGAHGRGHDRDPARAEGAL